VEATEVGFGILLCLVGALTGAAGAGWGVGWSLRERIVAVEQSHGSRLQAAEARIGIDRENRPTGNGLIGEVHRAHDRIDRVMDRERRDVRRIHERNRRQHPRRERGDDTTTDEDETT
jgi:hypothetical protein